MKRAARNLLLVLAAVLLPLVVLLSAALQDEPALQLAPDPSPQDVARAIALARQHDPRQAAPGQLRHLALSERDVDVLLNHAAHGRLPAALRVEFLRGEAHATASLHLPANPFGRWLNLQVVLAQTGGLPVLASVHAGRVPVPVWLAERLVPALLARSGVQDELRLVADVTQRVVFQPQLLQVMYRLQSDSAERMLSALVPQADQLRLKAYAERLAQVAAMQPPGWTASLAPFIGPMFELASRRSAEGGDPALENRAALMMLTLYANGRSLAKVIPAARQWPWPRPLRLTLAGRDDFSLHLLVSASLAAEGTSPLSRAVGIYKEIADSRGGSGFSFNDIAADRAGTRIGQLAVTEPRRLQAVLARGVQESDILPPWSDLPEFMPEPEFRSRFGGIGAPAYLAMIEEIDRRIAALPVLR